jgi:hypothetical protein
MPLDRVAGAVRRQRAGLVVRAAGGASVVAAAALLAIVGLPPLAGAGGAAGAVPGGLRGAEAEAARSGLPPGALDVGLALAVAAAVVVFGARTASRPLRLAALGLSRVVAVAGAWTASVLTLTALMAYFLQFQPPTAPAVMARWVSLAVLLTAWAVAGESRLLADHPEWRDYAVRLVSVLAAVAAGVGADFTFTTARGIGAAGSGGWLRPLISGLLSLLCLATVVAVSVMGIRRARPTAAPRRVALRPAALRALGLAGVAAAPLLAADALLVPSVSLVGLAGLAAAFAVAVACPVLASRRVAAGLAEGVTAFAGTGLAVLIILIAQGATFPEWWGVAAFTAATGALVIGALATLVGQWRTAPAATGPAATGPAARGPATEPDLR